MVYKGPTKKFNKQRQSNSRKQEHTNRWMVDSQTRPIQIDSPRDPNARRVHKCSITPSAIVRCGMVGEIPNFCLVRESLQKNIRTTVGGLVWASPVNVYIEFVTYQTATAIFRPQPCALSPPRSFLSFFLNSHTRTHILVEEMDGLLRLLFRMLLQEMNAIYYRDPQTAVRTTAIHSEGAGVRALSSFFCRCLVRDLWERE